MDETYVVETKNERESDELVNFLKLVSVLLFEKGIMTIEWKRPTESVVEIFVEV